MITEEQHRILLGWLTDVDYYYYHSDHVSKKAIEYVDRFLEKNPTVPKTTYQLIGCAALLVASKLESDRLQFSCDNLSHLTNRSFSAKEIAECEILLLFTLDWKVL